MNPNCPKCNEISVKNGFARGNQRWKCKGCNFQFTRLTPKGKPLWMKLLAVMLYISGMSMNSIATTLKVSAPTILEWIRNFARANYEKPEPTEAVVIELDEMWHFVGRKKTSYGYGKLFAEIQEILSTGNLETVTLKH